MSEELNEPELPKPENYRERLEKMSDHQLRGELLKVIHNRDLKPIAAIEALTLLIVLENTQTRQNPKAKLEAFPR